MVEVGGIRKHQASKIWFGFEMVVPAPRWGCVVKPKLSRGRHLIIIVNANGRWVELTSKSDMSLAPVDEQRLVCWSRI